MRVTMKWLLVAMMVSLAVGLAVEQTRAQTPGTGTIEVTACTDQNADGDCNDGFDGPAPVDTVACLNDTAACLPVPATFDELPPGPYSVFLQFPGASQGYYPTTPRQTINLAADETVDVTLGAVYPIHPKGIAVHRQLNKVYVAFQGPTIGGIRPYPFVAVIDGDTDEVLRTIPGGENGFAPGTPHGAGVGRDSWGVGVSANGEFVYVGSFGDGIITIIDPVTDVALTNISPGVPFKPVAPAVSPETGRVHFTDYDGGRMLVLNDDPGTFPTNPIPKLVTVADFPDAFSPFEIAVADTPFGGYNFITLRDAFAPNPFKFVGLRSTEPFNFVYHDINLPGDKTGSPHAIALWQEAGRPETRLFMTYAADPRTSGESFPNPNRLLMYGFDPATPDLVSLRTSTIQPGDYAEVGLLHNAGANHMIGSYAGFPYLEDLGHVAACDNGARGGTYALTYNGDRLGVADGAATPEVWKYPTRVIGNPPYDAADMRWRNPFEMALNPNNGKVYVTDRCWNEFPEGGVPGGGAVLIFNDTRTPETPTESNPALTVTKSDSRDPVIAGNELIYTIRVVNTGDVNLNATIVDTLPPEVTPNQPPVWENVFIPFGGFWEGTLSVTVNPGISGILTNRVNVTTDEGVSGEAVEDTLSVISAVQVRKFDSIDPVVAGDVLTYTIEVQNVGELDLHTTITDTLPPEVTPFGPTTWGLLIPADQTLVLTVPVQVTPNARGPLVNRVDVTTAEGPSNWAEETTLVANLAVTKTAFPEPVNAGESLTYTIRVDNLGSVDLNASIIDTLPPEAIPTGPTSWNVLIPVGGFWEQPLVVTVDPNTYLPITNTVAVTTAEGASGQASVTSNVVSRGVIFVKACHDQDADGVCGQPEVAGLPSGILGCLRDSTGANLGCQPIGPAGAIFTNLVSTNTYTPYLQFTGDSQGYFPTTRPQGLAVSSGVEVTAFLGAVYPVHPKGVAVHPASNKIYVAMQGPKTDTGHPFPFVAVIDGQTDEVLYTIPGGPAGIGRDPWGVAVSGDYVYVGSFIDGRVSVIDTATDLVVANPQPAGTFAPTAPAVSPTDGRVHFPDYRGGRTIILEGTSIVDGAFVHAAARGLSPFEMAIADFGSRGFSFVSLRDALQPYPYKIAALNNDTRQLSHIPMAVPGGSGNPHAVSLWEQPGQSKLFVTYADDPRPSNEPFPNPNKLAVFSFNPANPGGAALQTTSTLPDYAETGLIFDPTSGQMVGTFTGFPYSDANGDAAACNSPEQGGIYTVDFNGGVGSGPGPSVAVGNPPVVGTGFGWKNPFELAVNPNTGKIYVSDRCWNEYPGLPAVQKQGAVLVFGWDAMAVGAATVARPGDVNGDGRVNIFDISFVGRRYGTNDLTADLNHDGTVDLLDITIVATNYSQQ